MPDSSRSDSHRDVVTSHLRTVEDVLASATADDALVACEAALDHLRADLAGNGVDVGDLELHHGGAGGERDGDGPTHGASRAEGTPVDPTPRGSDRPDRTATLPGGSLSLDL